MWYQDVVAPNMPAARAGVDPGGEAQGMGEVEGQARPLLRDPGREGHVVPSRVAAEHAGVEAELGREGPLGNRPGSDAEGDPEGQRRELRGGDLPRAGGG